MIAKPPRDAVEFHQHNARDFASRYHRSPGFNQRLQAWQSAIHRHLPEQGNVLDAGCGPGEIAALTLSRTSHLTCVDASQAMLELARERLPASVKFAKADLARLPFANHHFDVVLLSSVLEYLPQPEVALAELRRVAKPGAILLAGVPNVRSIYRSLETIASSAIGLPRYRRHVNPDVPSAANALITAAGFQITDELLYASPPGLRVLTLSSWAGVHPRFATMRLIAATAA